MTSYRLTLKGWFGICPVYLGDLDTASPLMVERHPFLMPLMVVSEWFFGACIFVISVFDPSFEPVWPIRITGELEQPIEIPRRGAPGEYTGEVFDPDKGGWQ